MATTSTPPPATRVTSASPDTLAPPAAAAAASHAPASSDDSNSEAEKPEKNKLSRPPLGSRKSSGTIIIPRESPAVEVREESYEPDDARAMSPRRSSEEIDKMGDDARAALEEQANTLQTNLLEIIERVDSVKSEHEKLEGGNKFLQSYIGELMSTAKIASTASKPSKSKKGRSTK